MALLPEAPAQRSALFAIFIVLAAVYFFNDLWWSPTKEEIAQMETRLEQLEDQNRRAQVIAARGGRDLQERLALYERHVEKLEELIPRQAEVPALLNAISLEARQARVEHSVMRPEPVEVGPYYTRESYEMGVIGAYHDVGRFLTAIASLSRIITPVDLELIPFQGQEIPLEAEHPVEARFRIETYVLPTPGDAAAPANPNQTPS